MNVIRAFAIRFIPTCVGSISARINFFSSSSVHPHVRGEHGLNEGLRPSRIEFIPTCVGSIC